MPQTLEERVAELTEKGVLLPSWRLARLCAGAWRGRVHRRQRAAAGDEDQVKAHGVEHAEHRIQPELSAFPEFGLVPEARADARELRRVDLPESERASGTISIYPISYRYGGLRLIQ